MSQLPQHDLDVIEPLIDDALALGYVVSVNDGEEWALKRSADRAEILSTLAATDADLLMFRDAAGEKVGTVYLVYGNEPGAVICDTSDSPAMNALLKRAEGIADRIYNRAA